MGRVRFVLLLLVAGLIVMAGLGVFLWGGLVASFITTDGNTPGDVPGFVLIVVGMCLMGGGVKLWGLAARMAGWDLFEGF